MVRSIAIIQLGLVLGMVPCAEESNPTSSGDQAPATTSAPVAAAAEPITIKLEPCKASRVGKRPDEPLLSRIFDSGPKMENLVLRGLITVDEVSAYIYLPDKKPYTLINTGKSDTDNHNNSTLLAIDVNQDEKITTDENWYANLPVRIADRMFDVTAIAEDGSSITFTPSSRPLSGIVVGRKLPDFSYQTDDGKLITQDDYKGKAFLLDIWSVT